MKANCEKIIFENEKLKLSDLEKSLKNIFEYLNLHHKVNYLQVSVKSQFKDEILYDNTDSDLFLIDSLDFKQNNDTLIRFSFFSDDETSANKIKNDFAHIKMSLQIFSQSLYNKYMEKSINELSLIDHITGSYNRCYLNNYINNILSISDREQKKIAFLKIAIDQFKAVIDEFDYTIGDKVLKALADTLKESIRESDLVIKISNDEFLVVLQNVINENNAIMISDKLINNFSEIKVVVNDLTNQTLMKTICSGITIYPDDATNIDEILKKSDIALYEAKNRGRSQTFKFCEEKVHTIDFF